MACNLIEINPINIRDSMKEVQDMKPLSEALLEPLVNAHKVGIYGLAFGLVGTMLLVATLFLEERILRYLIGALGASIILMALGLFYFQTTKKLIDVNRSIQKKQELINTVQETAIQMTDLAYTIQALAFKNANELATAITQVRNSIKDVTVLPVLSKIPGVEQINKIADNRYVVKAEDLSKSIVATTVTAKVVIEDVKTALIQSDLVQLKKYFAQLKKIDVEAKGLLEN